MQLVDAVRDRLLPDVSQPPRVAEHVCNPGIDLNEVVVGHIPSVGVDIVYAGPCHGPDAVVVHIGACSRKVRDVLLSSLLPMPEEVYGSEGLDTHFRNHCSRGISADGGAADVVVAVPIAGVADAPEPVIGVKAQILVIHPRVGSHGGYARGVAGSVEDAFPRCRRISGDKCGIDVVQIGSGIAVWLIERLVQDAGIVLIDGVDGIPHRLPVGGGVGAVVERAAGDPEAQVDFASRRDNRINGRLILRPVGGIGSRSIADGHANGQSAARFGRIGDICCNCSNLTGCHRRRNAAWQQNA